VSLGREDDQNVQRTTGVLALGARILLLAGLAQGCAVTPYSHLNARAMATPVEPPSAELAARFCMERARELGQRERRYRRTAEGAGVFALVTSAGAFSLALTKPDESSSAHRALETTEYALFSAAGAAVILGVVALVGAAYAGDDAKVTALRGYDVTAQADRLPAMVKAAKAVSAARQERETAVEEHDDLKKNKAPDEQLAAAKKKVDDADAKLAQAAQDLTEVTPEEPAPPSSEDVHAAALKCFSE
jgi:hypothetical protein